MATSKRDRLQGLYVLTDPTLTPAHSLLSQVEQTLLGGAEIVQYRDKSQDQRLRQQQGAALLQLCHRYQKTLIINDDVHLAATLGADGVHLGLEDMAISTARQILGTQAIIGATCHGDIDLARAAIEQGADYVAFGRFFPSSTKPAAPAADLSALNGYLAQLPKPAVAIGGITLANAPQLCAAGFAMLAVVADVFAQTNIHQQCQAYRKLFS